MRLITRSDFDGLICAVLLKNVGIVDEYKFAHPKDIQDGLVPVTENDILANVPYVEGCGMWFDHHSSESERLGAVEYKGASRLAPSCARVIWDYYGGEQRFSPSMKGMMDAVDKVDSAQLSEDDIANPKGWILLGFLMDPRTGLGRYRDYRIGNYELMMDLIDYCATLSVEEILAKPDVQERVSRYFTQQEDFTAMLKRNSTLHGNVLVVDLRDEEEIFTGNRFTMYSLYPTSNISIQVIWGLKKQNVVLTVGYSVLNRTCNKDVGKLMFQYGGGGHKQVGTCQVPVDDAARVLNEVIAALQD